MQSPTSHLRRCSNDMPSLSTLRDRLERHAEEHAKTDRSAFLWRTDIHTVATL